MRNEVNNNSEHGGTGVKFLMVLLAIVLAANAGYNYIPVAYGGANFRQEMDIAVVNGLATAGKFNPVDVVKNKLDRAAAENNVPTDAVIEVKQVGAVIQAHAAYTKPVGILPFGLYKYNYRFDYTAVPQGYLLKDSKIN